MMNKHYILDKKHRIVETDLMGWAEQMKTMDRIVKQEDIGKMWVSTVFLGLDHSWSETGPPILFETMMTYSGSWQDYQTRCATWEQAEEMHRTGVKYAIHYQTWHQRLKRWIQSWFQKSA